MDMWENLKNLFRPVKKAELGVEISGPTTAGVRQVLSGHPAYGITPQRMGAILREAEAGDEIAYLELAEEMEEKDCHYRAVLATRKLQVAGLEMSVEAASDKPDDIRAADLCREIFPVIRPALFDIMDAVGKGFSVCELVWDISATPCKPKEIIWRDPRWFGFDPITGKGPFLRGETGLLEPLAENKFVVHRVRSKSGLAIRGGLARAAAWAWLFKNYDLKSWNIFCEVYGHPLRLGKYDASASEKDRQTLLRAVRDLGSDHAAIVPLSMAVEFIDAKAQGNAQVFQQLAEYLDMQMSKLVLGQTGTTDTGSRVGTAEAHERVRADIEAADAEALASTITRDVLTPLVRLNLGPHIAVPTFHLKREKPEDLTALSDNLAKLAHIAPRLVEVSVIRDKFGFPEPAEGAPCIGDSRVDEVEVIDEIKNSLPPKPSTVASPVPTGEDIKQAAESQPLQNHDWLDDLTEDALSDWIPVVEPARKQLQELLDQCADYDEFQARLAGLAQTLDVDELRNALASYLFAARHLTQTGVEDGNA